MHKLGVIIASVRNGRVGLPVANWFLGVARTHGKFDVTALDLKEVDLPLLEEARHPRLMQYADPRTKAWSATVAAVDAFVIVTPEYNYSAPPALINALDHLYNEWSYKAAAFVSYGGVSGGIRSVQMSKQLLAALKMVPIVEAVAIPFVAKQIDTASGTFMPNEANDKAATVMLDELVRWTDALGVLRVPVTR